MKLLELRELEDVRAFVTQGLWLQRVTPPAADRVRQPIEWMLELAAGGQGVGPAGFLSDLGHCLMGTPPTVTATPLAIPGFPPALARAYDDYALGKILCDFTLERAADALRRYQGRDKARGLAFVLRQFQERTGLTTVSLNPAVLKELLRTSPAQILKEGWDSLLREGVLPEIISCYEALVQALRQCAEILAPEDVFELEHGTAVAEFGQRVALRQVLRAAELLDGSLPRHRPHSTDTRREVPTRVLDEDTYPVGGFSSLATRGSIESLLHSQLALMEKEARPDLFDVKYVRDELLYYARDENTFLRRRRTFVVVLEPDLMQARFKDADLPYQRIILLLALLVVVVRRLCSWLSADALRFEILFLEQDGNEAALRDERELLQTVLREELVNGTLVIESAASIGLIARRCALHGRRSLCHCLWVGMSARPVAAADTRSIALCLGAAGPQLSGDDGELSEPTAEPLEGWFQTVVQLLARWL